MKIIFLFLLSFNAMAATERTISVTGQCMRKVAPDRGTVTLVSQFVDRSATVASRKATDGYQKIREVVQKMKLKDLEMQTSEYSVQELVDYPNGKRVSRGMQAALGLQIVTSEISRLGDVAALSSQLEINRVENLNTFLSPEKSKTTREACLAEAIKNARDKAIKMAQSVSLKVGDVLLIDENVPLARELEGQAFRAMAKSDSAEGQGQVSPTIESRPETISVNVLVKFNLN